MPIAIDSNETVPGWLEVDEGKPAEARPTFFFRFLTKRQKAAAVRILEEARVAKSDDLAFKKLEQALAIGLAGWKNVIDPDDGREVPFPVAATPSDVPKFCAALEAALTEAELFELGRLMIERPALVEIDRKKSSPAATSPSSAEAA